MAAGGSDGCSGVRVGVLMHGCQAWVGLDKSIPFILNFQLYKLWIKKLLLISLILVEILINMRNIRCKISITIQCCGWCVLCVMRVLSGVLLSRLSHTN